MFWFIVLLLLAGAGFYFYQKMMEIEREIRAEQDAGQASAGGAASPASKPEPVQDEPSDSQIVTPEVDKMTTKVVPVADASLSLEDEILAAIKNLPGVKQTEIYASFADVNKKQLQQLLKELADGGKINREKKGSSYLLYPA